MKFICTQIKPVLALLVTIFSFSYFFVATFTTLQADPQIIIAIVAAQSQALQYYFGSSTGGAKKDEVISDLSKKQ